MDKVPALSRLDLRGHDIERNQLGSKRAKAGLTSSLKPITDTSTRMVEYPLVLFLDPEMPTANESLPRKLGLVVYEKPEPTTVTWPDRGRDIRRTVAL
jgi:hypothetical protein